MAKKNSRKVDVFWELAFNKFGIFEKIQEYGYFEISTDEIKSIHDPVSNKTFEPRLVTKFDSRSELPSVFKDNEDVIISIMSSSRRTYTLVLGDLYKELNTSFKFGHDRLVNIKFPEHIKSINKDRITSESNALNVALLTGIFDDFFDTNNFVQTISGRMSTGKWSYSIGEDKIELQVENAQMEIDGSLENREMFVLIEAKNKINSDFIIRQLYFPFRYFYDYLEAIEKEVKTIFVIYSMNVFTIIEYKFDDKSDLSSVKECRKAFYTFESRVSAQTIQSHLKNFQQVELYEVFPQADDLSKVINIVELLATEEEKSNSYLGIAKHFDFDARQGLYYRSGCYFLNLIDENGITENGEYFVNCGLQEKILYLLEVLYSSPSFKYYIDCKIFKKDKLSEEKLLDLLTNYEKKKLSASTAKRRMSTLKAWMNYILLFIDI